MKEKKKTKEQVNKENKTLRKSRKVYEPPYGDLTRLNTSRVVLDSLGKNILTEITRDYLDLLETSGAIYETNGDYAVGIFSSGWCRLLDLASRNLCGTDNNKEALNGGKWLCHESCWTEASKVSIEKGRPTDIECHGGIRLYAVPIWSDKKIVGSMNFGYGHPPGELAKLNEISEKYGLSMAELHEVATMYEPRSPFIIDLAKKHMLTSAKLVGEMIARKQAEQALQKAHNRLEQRVAARTMELKETNEDLEREITERKRAEEKLRKSEKKLRMAVVSLNFNVFTQDKELRFTWVFNPDPSFDQKSLLGKTDGDFLLSAEASVVTEIKKRVLETGVREQSEIQLTVEGKVCDFEIVIEPLRNVSGDIVGIVGVTRDITERKQAEEALRESEKKYRTLVNEINDGFFSINKEGAITFANKALSEMLGYAEPMELYSKKFMDFRSSDERELGIDELVKIVEDKGQLGLIEESMIKKNGDKRIVQLKPTPIIEQGKVIGFSGVIRDITEVKQAEEEKKELEFRLQHAQKMEAIGTLAGGIAHDFNNILASIIGYTELSLENVEKESQLQRNLQEVYKAGIRAKNLVKQILTFSRKSDQEFQPFQVKLIVEEALNLLRATLPTTIEIHRDIQSNSIMIGDPSQIHQVLMNLCTNAGYAMQEKGGVLEVRLEDVELDDTFTSKLPNVNPGTYVRLVVHDTGFGMTPEVLKQAFNPFFTTKEKGEGTGIGLAVVHGIVQNHGGTITAYSELGKGSTFNVLIPLPEKGEQPNEQIEKSIPKGNERILYVDDEEMIADMGKQMLESLGYEVTIKTSSIEALKYFESHSDKFDLIITDQTMPKLTGHELARKILKIRPDIPIILCTGFSAKIDEKKASANGINAFLLKPILKHTIGKAIRKVLD